MSETPSYTLSVSDIAIGRWYSRNGTSTIHFIEHSSIVEDMLFGRMKLLLHYDWMKFEMNTEHTTYPNELVESKDMTALHAMDAQASPLFALVLSQIQRIFDVYKANSGPESNDPINIV